MMLSREGQYRGKELNPSNPSSFLIYCCAILLPQVCIQDLQRQANCLAPDLSALQSD